MCDHFLLYLFIPEFVFKSYGRDLSLCQLKSTHLHSYECVCVCVCTCIVECAHIHT